MDLNLGNAGWVRYTDTGQPIVYLRYLPDPRGRWALREVFIDGTDSDPLTVKVVQSIPFSNIEATVNRESAVMHKALEYAESPVRNVAVLMSHYAGRVSERWWVNFGKGQVRRQSPPRRAKIDSAYVLDGPPPPDGLTDDFLRKVARAYAAAIVRGEAPNEAIYSQVPQYASKRAVEWWVRKARERGIMPPGRRGARG